MRVATGLLALALLGGADGAAQMRATVDAGGTRVTYDGDVAASTLSLSPSLVIDDEWSSFGASGTVARFGTGEWSVQGDLAGSGFARVLPALHAELGASLGGTAQAGAPSTAAAAAQGRLHLLGGTRGAWLGGEAGRASDGAVWRTTLAGDLGAWARLGELTVVARAAPSAVGDGLRYLDAHAAGRLERGGVELTASLGVRDWSRPDDAATTAWGGVSGAYWLSDRLAVVAGAGRYPVEYAQGFPGGSYVTLGVRLATRRATVRQAVSETAAHRLPPLPRPVAGAFTARRAGDGHWTLEVWAPDARAVEVIGDFTEWRPLALKRDRERWSATVALGRGTHRMNLRVDGGPWGAPEGLPVVRDEFSGVVALLTVQ